jgi:uncharacterized membrane protein
MSPEHTSHHSAARRHFLVRQVRAWPRLLASILFAALLFAFLPETVALQTTTRLLLTWNGGVSLYLLSATAMIIRSSHEHIHPRAQEQEEGRLTVMAGIILATIACLAAIFIDLANVRDMHGSTKYGHIILAVMTVATSWFFIHMMFAFNYAHDFYIRKNKGHGGGLLFPGTENPDYADFLYYAYIIGTSGQTADVSITSQPMRRISLMHCVLAYVFNTTVLALTINLAAGLL